VTDGTDVACWGDDKYGQAGDTSNANQFSPISVADLNAPVRGIASGGFHTCVLDAIGMQCWGYDGYGELGDGTYTNSGNPVQVINVAPPT
jgi:alpha-tubulin suppressor-like RCC1 family protein